MATVNENLANEANESLAQSAQATFKEFAQSVNNKQNIILLICGVVAAMLLMKRK